MNAASETKHFPESNKNEKSKRISGIIRKVTVPPVMIVYLIIVLAAAGKDVFQSGLQIFLALFFLGILPVLAYPLQKIMPGFKGKGRDGQRKLAFLFTFIGYTANFIYAVTAGVTRNYFLVASTYFLSIVILSLLNLFTPLKASGHACSIAGPAALLSFLIHPIFILIGIILAVIVGLASVIMKRHTIGQFIGGIASCLAGFLISVIIL